MPSKAGGSKAKPAKAAGKAATSKAAAKPPAKAKSAAAKVSAPKVPAAKGAPKVPAAKDAAKVPAAKDAPKVPAAKDAAKVPAAKDAAKVPAAKVSAAAKAVAPAKPAVVAKPAAVAKAVPDGNGSQSEASPASAPSRAKAEARKSSFDEDSLATIHKRLTEQRGELERQLTSIEESATGLSQSEMSGEVSYDEDFADAGSFTFEREKEFSIANNVSDLRSKIDRALHNIEEGTYGICESCGQPIEGPRLKALPHVTLCLKCKKAEERR